MFSKKATKTDEIFTVDLTLCSKCQIDGEDFVKFYGLLRKHKLYVIHNNNNNVLLSSKALLCGNNIFTIHKVNIRGSCF